jgi:uncharacterized membrane protein
MLADWISGLLGLIGILLLSYGTYLIAPYFGFISMGVALIIFSYLLARANANANTGNQLNKLKKNKK